MANIYDHQKSICEGTNATHNTWGAISSPFTNSGKDAEVPAKKRNTQREHNRMVMQQVLKHIMPDLLQNDGRHFYTYCADGKLRRCYPTLAAWMADYPEHCNLHNIKSGVCYWCECPQEKIGDHLRPADWYPIRNHTLYRQLWE